MKHLPSDKRHLKLLLQGISVYLLFVNLPQLADARYAVIPRQDDPSPTQQVAATPSKTYAGPEPEHDTEEARPSIAASTTVRPPSRPVSSSFKAAASSTSLVDSNGMASATSSPYPPALTATPIATSNTTSTIRDQLPLNPIITPALSIAGAILMLTGLLYTLIGIKTKWLHIFLSAAYLASLAVTVLIVYVMHPPVSNAVQGAYFVAAFVTGIIFGGGSVLFADVTEGLGCLLGGYCLSMWLLILKPDGLIKSTAGKAIFIACFTLGACGFYISHWTRAYGLIGATSFAGATVIVLGMDCFSRAGLKEFWLYIWVSTGLNENIFPLRYNGPYPHTRGIRVEIAAVILIFLIGVMSQVKVWRIIERRRAERAAEHLRKQQIQEQAENELGRKIEEGNQRDLNLWEAAYGGKNGTNRHVDSGFTKKPPSVRKASLGVVGTNEIASPRSESFEMVDLNDATTSDERDTRSDEKGKARATITVRVASDDDAVQFNSRPGSTINAASPASPQSEARTSQSAEICQPQPKAMGGISARPNVIPLPFSVPATDAESDRRSSIAASISSEPFSTRLLKRLSGTSLRRTSSKRSQRSSYIATSTSEEVVMLPGDDDADDRASSVAATFDEISDGYRSEVDGTTLAGLPPSPDVDPGTSLKHSPPTEPYPVNRLGRQASKTSLGHASSHSVPIQDESTPATPTEKSRIMTDNVSPAPVEDALRATSSHSNQSTVKLLDTQTTSPQTPSQDPSSPPTLRASLTDLPSASNLVLAYRTNEWAKHLSHAEKPSLDDLRSLHHQQSASAAAPTENPAPLNITALRQTPLNAEPAPAPNPRSSTHSLPSEPQETPTRSPLQQRTPSQSSLSSLPSQRPRPRPRPSQRPSSTDLQRAQPPHRLSPQPQRDHPPRRHTSHHRSPSHHHHHPHPHRLSSTPHASPTIDEENPTTTFPHRPLQPPHTLLQQSPSSRSLPRLRSYPSGLDDNDDDDNIPLSTRRTSLLNLTRHNHNPPTNHPDHPNHRHPNLEPRHHARWASKRRSESNLYGHERWRGGSGSGSGEGMEERHREAMRRMQPGVGV
ncbi:MAG: hypothetical protein Q9182_001947 [Xanthomendoza sp. 2 TL-2023]